MSLAGRRIIYLVSEDWYFCSHRLALGIAARTAGAEVIVATQIDQHRDTITNAGLQVEAITMQRSGINPFADLNALRQISALYKRWQPDLVHHVSLKPILYGSIAAKQAAVPAVVNAVAGVGFMFASQGLLARTVRPLIKRVQRQLMNRENTITILQNPDDVKFYEEGIGVDAKRIRLVCGAGVDITRFTVAPELQPQPQVIAVCVSRMLRHKGIVELVEAARLLHTRGVPIRVRLIGQSDKNPTSIPQAKLLAWQREGIVEVAGPSTAIAAEYANAHIAVLPSYAEGLPLSLLEAAACGRPMVATDVPGCREICIHEETGLLVPPRTVVPLAEALERLALDAKLRQRFGSKARWLSETVFAQSIINDQSLSLYQELLSNTLQRHN